MERTPIFDNGKPIWWHTHGDKMALVKSDCYRYILIESNAARLSITGSTSAGRWMVCWGLTHFSGHDEVEGIIAIDNSDLRGIFGLENYVDSESQWLIERYGGSAARQGVFIRYKDFLNIPCPGTGNDGDPNISIKISKDMRNSVIRMLSSAVERVPT